MKRLYILRHAKSSWDDPGMTDFDRPLNNRGLKTAPFMGEFMVEKGLIPDVIVSSPANRARQTAELVQEAADFNAAITFDERIYEAGLQTLMTIVSKIPDDHQSAMLVGHNPGMESLVRALTGQLHPMPTAALAVIDIDVESWTEAGPQIGRLKNVYRPKELMDR